MTREEQFHKVFMNIAIEISTLSRAERRKVGCIIVKEGNIIGLGFNGTPSGFDNCCEYLDEDNTLVTKPEVLHAESNALMKACTSTQSTKDADLYVTCEPCIECSKLIIQAKIKRVFYHESYRKHEGLELLRRTDIEVIQIYDE
jgi:dCMP deaminase